jgi:hypothetical protein
MHAYTFTHGQVSSGSIILIGSIGPGGFLPSIILAGLPTRPRAILGIMIQERIVLMR